MNVIMNIILMLELEQVSDVIRVDAELPSSWHTKCPIAWGKISFHYCLLSCGPGVGEVLRMVYKALYHPSASPTVSPTVSPWHD